jgi:hypothetical protein
MVCQIKVEAAFIFNGKLSCSGDRAKKTNLPSTLERRIEDGSYWTFCSSCKNSSMCCCACAVLACLLQKSRRYLQKNETIEELISKNMCKTHELSPNKCIFAE